MHHRPATSIAIILAVLSGFVLAQIWSLGPITTKSIQAVPSARVEATTLAFYQAVNAYLDNEDDVSLRRLLHPEFASRQPGGAATGDVEDFLRQLDSVRRFYPGIQLTADVTALGPNAASAALSWDVQERSDFAGIAIDPADMIGRLDLVRIERGLIVERRSSAALAGQLGAYPSLSIDLPVSLGTLVARVRQISLKGDYEPTTNQYGHLLLVDLSGEAFLEVLRPAAIPTMVWKMEREQAVDPAPVETGKIVTLGQMEAVFLPANTTFRMWDAGDQDAELLALDFGPPVSSETAPEASLLTELRWTLWSGIELKDAGDRLNLSFGRAELLPEATLSSPEVSGIELTWVTSGTLDMAGARGEARVRKASGTRSQLIEGHALLQAGEAGAAGPGANISYQASGNIPAAMWFFSLVPPSEPRNSGDADTVSDGSTPIPTPPPVRNVS